MRLPSWLFSWLIHEWCLTEYEDHGSWPPAHPVWRGKADCPVCVKGALSVHVCLCAAHSCQCLLSDQNTDSHAEHMAASAGETHRLHGAIAFDVSVKVTKVRKTLPTRQCVVPRRSTINRKHLSQNRKCCSLIGPAWFSKDQWQSSYF